MSNYGSFTNILQNDNIVLTFGTDNGGESVENISYYPLSKNNKTKGVYHEQAYEYLKNR